MTRAWPALVLLLLLGACAGESAAPARPGLSPPPSTTQPSTTPPSTTQPTTARGPLDEAGQAVDALMRALDAGECPAVKKLVLTPSAIDCGAVSESAGTFAEEGIDLDAVVYRSGRVSDDSTTVAITWGNGDPEESYDVQRVDGRWRVVFDSAA